MSAMTTLAPSSTNRRTVASPIPLAPPVMTATLPSSLSMRDLLPYSVPFRPHHLKHAVRAGQPLQLHLSPLAERDADGALRQLLEQRRDQDLAARSLGRDTGR